MRSSYCDCPINVIGDVFSNWIYRHVTLNPMYPWCTSLGRICFSCRFPRLMKSTSSYALSVGVRIPTPPTSTNLLQSERFKAA
jgi:hypothetical protein